jgi:hypothetical protein
LAFRPNTLPDLPVSSLPAMKESHISHLQFSPFFSSRSGVEFVQKCGGIFPFYSSVSGELSML